MIWELLCYAFVFIAEGLTAWIYYEYLFQRKDKSLKTVICFIGAYLVLFLLSQFESIAINGICYFAFNTFLLLLFYSCGLVAGVLHAAYLSFINAGTEFLVALLLSLVSNDFAAYSYDLSVMIPFSVLSRLLLFVIMQISARLIKPMKKTQGDWDSMILLALPVTSVLIAITVLYIGMAVDIPRYVGGLMVVSVLSLLLVNILVLIIYNHIQKISEERIELELIVQKESANTQYYAMLQKQYDDYRVLVHDIKRHWMIIQNYLAEQRYEELERYVSNVQSDPALGQNVRLSNEPILNIILVQYANKCKQIDAKYNFDVRECSLAFMRSADQTSLFDNLFSNAFEAICLSSQKHLDFFLEKQGEGVFLSLTNSCDIEPAVDQDGKITTRKQDKAQHGVGLKSIERVVQKYSGHSTFYYDKQNKQFHSVIFLAATVNGENT